MEGVLWRSPHDARTMPLPHLHKQSGCIQRRAQCRMPRTRSRTRERHSPSHPSLFSL